MKKRTIIILSIVIILALVLVLMMTSKDRQIQQLEEENKDLKENTTAPPVEAKSSGGIIGWLILVAVVVGIIVMLKKQPNQGEFDELKFTEYIRDRFSGSNNPLSTPIYMCWAMSLGYIKGNYKYAVVAATFTTNMNWRKADGEPPRRDTINLLRKADSFGHIDLRHNMTHEEFLKFCRDSEFRVTWVQQQPTGVSTAEHEAYLRQGFQEGLNTGKRIYGEGE